MIKPEDEDVWRVILNWIIPTSLGMTIIKVATKLIEKDTTVTGIVLTSLISLCSGIIIGAIIFMATNGGMWQALSATSFATLLGERVGHWFIYDFKIDKALNEISSLILEKIKKIFK